MICHRCKQNESTRAHGVCPSCISEINATSRAAQGLPRYIEDEATLRAIAIVTAPVRAA